VHLHVFVYIRDAPRPKQHHIHQEAPRDCVVWLLTGARWAESVLTPDRLDRLTARA